MTKQSKLGTKHCQDCNKHEEDVRKCPNCERWSCSPLIKLFGHCDCLEEWKL